MQAYINTILVAYKKNIGLVTFDLLCFGSLYIYYDVLQ